jgi:hypothetical protein
MNTLQITANVTPWASVAGERTVAMERMPSGCVAGPGAAP